jgi:hypothetical protein
MKKYRIMLDYKTPNKYYEGTNTVDIINLQVEALLVFHDNVHVYYWNENREKWVMR